MNKIVQISDLHFGAIDLDAAEALWESVEAIAPDVLVVSGDLTQRAKVSEFKAARAYLDRFGAPKIIVPGNHDVPLYNPWLRFRHPLRRYRQHVESNLSPTFENDEIFILGVNSTRSWTFDGGRIGERKTVAIRDRFSQVSRDKFRIMACHHPLHTMKKATPHWVRGHDPELNRIDLVLSGHLHRSVSEVLVVDQPLEAGTPGASALLVRAGTATSTRQRSETNSYNLISIEHHSLSIEIMTLPSGGKRFESSRIERFEREHGIWRKSV